MPCSPENNPINFPVTEGSEARWHIAEFQAQGRRQVARPAVVLRHLDGRMWSVLGLGLGKKVLNKNEPRRVWWRFTWNILEQSDWLKVLELVQLKLKEYGCKLPHGFLLAWKISRQSHELTAYSTGILAECNVWGYPTNVSLTKFILVLVPAFPLSYPVIRNPIRFDVLKGADFFQVMGKHPRSQRHQALRVDFGSWFKVKGSSANISIFVIHVV